ncbi:hypothetical protein [Chitinibacter tainanensis]|uniref:hypothetical protein n=1 Tax=Chitinibacter tainanensis TaxID=230667 RepID=UPI000429CD15|nr:hypothetical protein [Chitinibacter tainanensis]
MFKLCQRLSLIALLAVLTACANLAAPKVNLVQDGQLQPPAGQGIAVLAFTAQSFDRDTAEARLQLDGPAGRQWLQLRLVTDFIRAPGQQSNPSGRLFVLPLPAGEYRLGNIYGSWRRPGNSFDLFGNWENVFVPLDQRFTVRAGEVQYLGEIHLQMNYQSTVDYRQDFARDQYELQQRHGVSRTENIRQQPLAKPST